jgi:hypothetical protein
MTASPPHNAKVSELLAQFAATHAGGRITVGTLAEAFGERAFGALMLILALPNAVGLGTIPGLSTVFGLPQIFLALQMAAGRRRPWLPGWLARRSLAGADFRTVVDKAMPHLLRMERALKPRLPVLSSRPFERVLGLAFLILAAIVSLPIPLGNQPPAVAMAVMSLGLIEEDGAYIVGGFVLGLLATALAMAVVLGGAAAIYLLIDRLFT